MDSSQPKYGPFHRIKSPTQSDETARLQMESQELWGRPRRGSDIPQVQAYNGPLPPGEKGVEFETPVPPDRGLPSSQARWTGPRIGVTIEDGFCKIPIVMTKNTQTEFQEIVTAETEEAHLLAA